MSKFNYNPNVFAFTESELWDNIIFILEENIEAEVNNAIRYDNANETRIHACGRADALKDLLGSLLEQRRLSIEKAKQDIV